MKTIKKYFVAYILVFAIVLCAVPTVKAESTSDKAHADSDAVICVTTIREISETVSMQDSTAATASTPEYKRKTASKTKIYKNSAGKELWSVTITATFQYNGVNSGCISAKASATSYSSNWKVSDIRSTVNGANATGYATGRHYVDSKLVETVTKSVSVYCSPNGTIS